MCDELHTSLTHIARTHTHLTHTCLTPPHSTRTPALAPGRMVGSGGESVVAVAATGGHCHSRPGHRSGICAHLWREHSARQRRAGQCERRQQRLASPHLQARYLQPGWRCGTVTCSMCELRVWQANAHRHVHQRGRDLDVQSVDEYLLTAWCAAPRHGHEADDHPNSSARHLLRLGTAGRGTLQPTLLVTRLPKVATTSQHMHCYCPALRRSMYSGNDQQRSV